MLNIIDYICLSCSDCPDACQLFATFDPQHEAGGQRLEAQLAYRTDGQLPGLPEEDASAAKRD